MQKKGQVVMQWYHNWTQLGKVLGLREYQLNIWAGLWQEDPTGGACVFLSVDLSSKK